MWVKGKGHVSDRPAPPEDDGTELATFDRGDGKELRFRLKEYNGNPFISAVLWERGWPVKGRSFSIRLREVDQVVEALRQAVDLANEQDQHQDPRPNAQAPARRAAAPRADERSQQPADRSDGRIDARSTPPWEDRPRFVDKRRPRRSAGPTPLPPAGGRVDFDECN